MKSFFCFLILFFALIYHIKLAKTGGEETEGQTEPGSGTTLPITEDGLPDTTTQRSLKNLTFKEKVERFRSNPRSAFQETKKMITDILNFDLNKLDVKNLTQFVPFYTDYKKLFKKNYNNDTERNQRMGFFKKTIEKIKNHNMNVKNKYRQGINELSDMNFHEIVKQKMGLKQDGFDKPSKDKKTKGAAPVPRARDMPDEFDWRKYGILTEARNQGKCGSCWSFAAACVLESHNMKRLIAEGKFDPKKKLTVSEQNLIDCSADYGTVGCDGGMPQQGFKYVAANKGTNGVDTYPYTGEISKCKFDPAKKVDIRVIEGRRLKTGQDDDLANAIYNYGPVTVAIHVTKDMAAFKSGIFDDPTCDPKQVNHAVVAVGYSKEFFIIRNSWGPNWGEDGYFKISRAKKNNCGVSQQPYYPVLPNAVDTSEMKNKLKEIK